MNPCELNIAISAFANAISCKLTTDQLNLLGAILSQLGDTLDTIATQRSICEKNEAACKEKQKENSSSDSTNTSTNKKQ